MSDDFLQELESDGRRRFMDETVDLDTSKFDEKFDEVWRIQPMTAEARDKVLKLAAEQKIYEAYATGLVYSAYHRDKNGRRFRPTDIPKLMKNPDFLLWWANEVDFVKEIEFLQTGEEEAAKNSSGTTGSTE